MRIPKIIAVSVVSFLFLMQSASLVAFAGDSGTVLPATDTNVADCEVTMNTVEGWDSSKRSEVFGADWDTGNPSAKEVLACGIKTGNIKLWMMPYYIRYVLQFIIGLAGLVAVGGIVYGGYLYLFAGISEDKDKGKKAILYGVIGMVMTLVAWAFVNIVISVVTA